MSQVTCPQCASHFDNHRGGSVQSLRKRLFFGPERLIAIAWRTPAAYDTCPACHNRFVSPEFDAIGDFVRARLHSMSTVYLLGVLVIAAVLTSAMIGR